MIRSRALPIAAILLASSLSGAAAQDDAGRYTMTPTPEGALRLDRRTGVVSHCEKQGGAFRCSVVPDERHALQDEIDRLSRENAELRARLEAAGAAPKATPGLPTDAELDHALSLMERALRRFKEIMRDPADAKPL